MARRPAKLFQLLEPDGCPMEPGPQYPAICRRDVDWYAAEALLEPRCAVLRGRGVTPEVVRREADLASPLDRPPLQQIPDRQLAQIRSVGAGPIDIVQARTRAENDDPSEQVVIHLGQQQTSSRWVARDAEHQAQKIVAFDSCESLAPARLKIAFVVSFIISRRRGKAHIDPDLLSAADLVARSLVKAGEEPIEAFRQIDPQCHGSGCLLGLAPAQAMSRCAHFRNCAIRPLRLDIHVNKASCPGPVFDRPQPEAERRGVTHDRPPRKYQAPPTGQPASERKILDCITGEQDMLIVLERKPVLGEPSTQGATAGEERILKWTGRVHLIQELSDGMAVGAG